MKVYGSFQNRVLENVTGIKPEVGTRGVDNSSGWYIGRAEYYYDFTF